MVGHQSETLRRARGGRTIETGGARARSHKPRLWSDATTASAALEASLVHAGGVEKQSDGLAQLRNAASRAAPQIFRLDRVREARGNETQAAKGGDSSHGQRQSAGPQ